MIRYVYEYPAFDNKGLVICKPDFYLPDYGAYVEYWGMTGLPWDRLRAGYERRMRWKKERYQENGISAISLFLGDLTNLDAVFRPRLLLALATG